MLNLRPSTFEIDARGDKPTAAGNAATTAPKGRIENIFMTKSWDFAVGKRPGTALATRALIETHRDYDQYLLQAGRRKSLRFVLDPTSITHQSGSSCGVAQ
jgi:hypothetical protein